MSLINYVKCKDGVPVEPRVFRLKDTAPQREGITWLPFDTEALDAQSLKLEGGVLVEDAAKKATLDTENTKVSGRILKGKGLRTSAVAKLKALGLTTGEAKLLVGIAPTDADLGI